MENDLAVIANLFGEPARAAMLLSLMNGRALPAGELALTANVSPQTASGHLSKLVQAGLLAVETQGRHRYYRLAGTSVADAVESLMALAHSGHERKNAEPPAEGTLAYARTCYSHLAGWLGVRMTETLEQQGLLLPAQGKAFAVSDAGRAWFQELGIAIPAARNGARENVARRCLDWTERRPHLSGTLGVALARRLDELRWIAPIRNSRAVRVTLEGKQQLWKLLRLPLRG